MHRSSSRIIWVEGMPAVGKSTYADKLGKLLGFKVLEEPVDDNFYLEAFYKDPKKYAFGMQVYLLHHRYAMKMIAGMEAARGYHKGVILDRCMLGDRVFAKLHFEAGNISELDWECYNFCFQVMARTILPPTVLVYLDCDPEVAHERLTRRSRKAEASVPLEYLQQLRAGYEDLIGEIERGIVPWCHSVKVVRMDWNQIIDPADERRWQYTANTLRNICDRQPG